VLVRVCVCVFVHVCACLRVCVCNEWGSSGTASLCASCPMGWLQLVGSIKLQVSFAKEPYKRDNILHKETYNLIDPTDRGHPIYVCDCDAIT